MLCWSFKPMPEYACYRQVKNGIERFWWRDCEMFILSFNRGSRMWRHYVIHHQITGVQVGFVRWWYGSPSGEDLDELVKENFDV